MRALILISLLFVGCDILPTEPTRDCAHEMGCTERIAVPLDRLEVDYWVERARGEMRARIDSGQVGQPSSWATPRIEWEACPFFVRDSNDFGAVCARASANRDLDRIRVSTFERDLRGPLVMHESLNIFFLRAGRSDLAMKRQRPVKPGPERRRPVRPGAQP
jgi:hypothetical protein